MKFVAASAAFLAAAVAAAILGLLGRTLVPVGPLLAPFAPSVQGAPAVVVVDAQRAPRKNGPAGGSPAAPAPVEDQSSTGTAILATAPTATPTVPVPSGPPVVVPVLTGLHGGYVRDGRVTLALGWTVRTGTVTTVERRLAPLYAGQCRGFGAWEQVSATNQVPQGSCAIYRVLVDGTVVYEVPGIVRYDGTPPTAPEIAAVDTDAATAVAGGIVYVAAGSHAASVVVSATASDPESGLERLEFASGDATVDVEQAPWQTSLVAEAGAPITVTAVNDAGDETSATMPVVADGDGPTGGYVTYPSRVAPGDRVDVSYDPGVDDGAGVDASSERLERRVGTSTSDGCVSYGGWDPVGGDQTLPEGRCAQYRFRVSDRVGNETVYTSSIETVAPDVTPPRAAIVAPVANATLSGTVEIAAEASDGESGLASLEIQLQGPDGAWSTVAHGESERVTADWDTLAVAPGPYLLRAIATDRSGNVTTSETVPIVVAADDEAPAVALVSPAAHVDVDGVVNVVADATDEGSGVQTVTFQVRRHCGSWTDIATVPAAPFAAAWDTSSLPDGDYQLRAVATDARGNVGYSGSVSVEVEHPDDDDDDGDGDGSSTSDGVQGDASQTTDNGAGDQGATNAGESTGESTQGTTDGTTPAPPDATGTPPPASSSGSETAAGGPTDDPGASSAPAGSGSTEQAASDGDGGSSAAPSSSAPTQADETHERSVADAAVPSADGTATADVGSTVPG